MHLKLLLKDVGCMKHNGIHNVVYNISVPSYCIISVLIDGNKAAALPLLQTHTGWYTDSSYRLIIHTADSSLFPLPLRVPRTKALVAKA